MMALLVYGNVITFCVLKLEARNMLNSWSLRYFFVDSLGLKKKSVAIKLFIMPHVKLLMSE